MEAMIPAASRYAFCYDIQRQGQSDLSPAAPLHDLRPGLSPVGASLSPSVNQEGHPGPAVASQGWAKSKYTKRYTARLRSM